MLLLVLAIHIMNAVQARSAAVSAGSAAARSKGCSARATRHAFGSSDALRLVLGAHSRAPGTCGRAIMRIAVLVHSHSGGGGDWFFDRRLLQTEFFSQFG